MAQDQLFFVGQKAFITKDDHVLVLIDADKRLDFPGGKITENETDLLQSLQREVVEETQLNISIEHPFHAWYFTIGNERHSSYGKKVFLVAYICAYKSGEVTLSSEHASFQWIDKETYKFLDDGSDHFKALEKYFQEQPH